MEEISDKLTAPSLILPAHKTEDNCDVLGIKVGEIAASWRDGELTKLFMKHRGSDDVWFFVTPTPEEIVERIDQACREKARDGARTSKKREYL